MRVLIDTNIFIELEGTTVLDQSYPSLVRLLEDNRDKVLIHPSSLRDLERDSDAARKARNLSRISKYEVLARPPDCRVDFASIGINCQSPNDQVDCEILCAIWKNAAHFLITEDQGLHRKARAIGVSNRVLFVQQALTSFTRTYSNQPIVLPNIEQVYVHEFQDQLPDPLFDSLRGAYPGFDDWFLESSRSGREAWVVRSATSCPAAVCIFKVNDPEPLTDDGKALPAKALKLCTFKVGESVQGQKIGELFLKAGFRYAEQNRLEYIFVTVKRDQQPHLESLLTDFGFEIFGTKGDELVYLKSHPIAPPQLVPPMTSLDYHVRYSPHMLAGPSIRKFIIPIKPEYHKQLFSDWRSDALQIRLPIRAPSPGNAIKLAYLCHSNVSGMRPGDIVLFYRSEDFQELTTIGIVESAEHLNDADRILERVLKRTVYSISDIQQMAERDTLVILFRSTKHLQVPVSRRFLLQNGIKGNIQSIRQIDDETFWKIASEGGVENCLLAN